MKRAILLSLASMFVVPFYADVFWKIDRSNVCHTFALTDVDWINDFILHRFSMWEYDTFDAFEKAKDPNGIAIDIGAWIGTTAIWLSKNFAYVLSVEADKTSVEFLKKNLKASKCDNVIVCDKAIADSDKMVTFGPRLSMGHGDALNGSTSFIKIDTDAQSDYQIEALSLETIINSYICQNPDVRKYSISFIKCDIEGGEEFILEDIMNFAHANNAKVWMSFHVPWWTTKKITDYAELFKKFNAVGVSGDVCEYVTATPFGSVLFEPC